MPTLKELQSAKNLSVATMDLIGLHWKNDSETDKDQIKVINEYLSGFLFPSDKDDVGDGRHLVCPSCNCPLGGTFGVFRWGLCAGEGECNVCGYPCRALHRFLEGEPFLEVILPYHPKRLKERKPI